MKILILCTGNSCRSQMAEGFLKAFNEKLEVHSAGTAPSSMVHPKAMEVMQELGIDLSSHTPEKVDLYLDESWDYVITVCGGAQESCPAFVGEVKTQLHIGFEDPADAQGTEVEIREQFRTIRDQILRDFFAFYVRELKN
jgi:arsenate reductase